MEKSNVGNLPKGVRTLSIRKILLIFHQVTTTLTTLQAVYTHRGQYIVKKYIPSSPPNIIDGEMISCPCGWTLISPLGEDDIKKHAMMHGKDCHPGLTTTQEEVAKMIKNV